MAPTPSRRREMLSAAASSDEEYTASDDDEAEGLPTKSPPAPAPVDGDDEDESESESDGVALKPTPLSKENVRAASSSSNEEYTSSEGDEAERRPTKSTPAPAPVDGDGGDEEDGKSESEEDTSSDEDEAGRRPTKNPPTPAPDDGDGDGEEDEVGESEGVLLEPTRPSKEHVPSAELTKLTRRKRKAPPAEQADLLQIGNSTEKQFEQKIASHLYLGLEVMALEAERPGLFKRPFLKLDHAKAGALDTKIKKQRLAEIRVAMRRRDIEKEVTKVLIDLLK